MFKILRQFLPFFLLGIILFSCTQENIEANTPNEKEPVEQSKHFVHEKEASDLAAAIQFPTQEGSQLMARGVTNSAKEVESITPVPDDRGNTSYYIINYVGGGFLILSADKRVNPVLAFSESNEFPVDAEEYPGGLVDWLVNEKDFINHVRDSIDEQPEDIAEAWQPREIERIIHPIEKRQSKNIRKGGYPYGFEVGPLLKTEWGQGYGYNDLLDYRRCSKTGNGRVPTGCVATAMAQIMKYHRFPSGYDWDAMPNYSGTYETSRLMRDIGRAVGMDYECNGSGSSTKNEGASSFVNDFGYSSASYLGYNGSFMFNEIGLNKPVILRGGRKSGWWIFANSKDSHAWVCDGYKFFRRSRTDISTFYHMNWGWGGLYNDWYQDNWNPGNVSFNYKRGMIYNVKP